MRASAVRPARPAAGRRTFGLVTAADLLALLALLLLFTVSSMALHHWGFHYETSGGSVLEKMHPGTWAACLAAAALAAARGPVRLADDVLRSAPGLVVYALGLAFLLAYTVVVLDVPFTPIIDTFFLPLVLFVVLRNSSARRASAFLLHALMAANALIALGELLGGVRLTPYTAAGVPILGDWRSTALFGHPLANACLAGAYTLILATGGGRSLPLPMRVGAVLLQILAMAAFGGRAAMVLVAGFLILLALGAIIRVLAGGRFNLSAFALSALLLPALGAGAVAVAESGLFDRALQRFVSDEGSAQTRISMFSLFGELSWGEILLGPDPDHIRYLQWIERLEFGIESFWVAFVLTYGLAASLVFFLGLAAFCREILRAAPKSWAPLLYFFTVASTSNSLSAKGALFAMTLALVLVLYGWPGRARTIPARARVKAHADGIGYASRPS